MRIWTLQLCMKLPCQSPKWGLIKYSSSFDFPFTWRHCQICRNWTEPPLCTASIRFQAYLILEQHFSSNIRHRFILQSVVVTDSRPPPSPTDAHQITGFAHASDSNGSLCGIGLYDFCHVQPQNAHDSPIKIHNNAALDSWPQVSRDELNW